MSQTPLRIEIAAGLGTGKTTAAQVLANAGLSQDIESHAHNPFIEAFYQDPVHYAFETEMTFLMQHYHDMKNRLVRCHAENTPAIVFDYSLLLDRAYADVTLTNKQNQGFAAAYEAAKHEIGRPDILIHLECNTPQQMQRIRERGREIEQGIPADYIEQLAQATRNAIAREPDYARRIITVDTTARDLRHNADDQNAFTRYLHQNIKSLKDNTPGYKPPTPG